MKECPQEVVNGVNRKQGYAFEYLFNAYYASLCHYAKQFVGDFMDEEDIVQEIFMKLWERKGEFENVQGLNAYLYRSVHNACLVCIRNNKKKRGEDFLVEASEKMAFEAPDNEELLIEEEYYRQILCALDSLSLQRRIIVELTIEGKSNEDIAQELNISINTVKTLKKKAYLILRQQLSRECWMLFFLFL